MNFHYFVNHIMKYFVILLVLIGFTGLIIPQSFALCLENEDWSNAPCMDSFPINRTEFQMDWAPYYDYKGSELMESKYFEMQQAINNRTFNEWNDDRENSNVYHYYLSVGEVTNQQDHFVFDDEIRKYTAFPPYFVITVASIFVIIIIVIVIAFVIRRNRK